LVSGPGRRVALGLHGVCGVLAARVRAPGRPRVAERLRAAGGRFPCRQATSDGARTHTQN
jgi:hypothetical protein